MKRLLKHRFRIIAVLFAFILVFSNAAYAADINITLTDASRDGLKISDNNFFAAFNGIVPGETKRQDLIFTNTYGQNACFYIFSEVPDESNELMKKLNLKLKNGDKDLYSCSLANVIRRKDLCTLKKNQSCVISMYMTMPEDIDNTYAGQTIDTKWYVGVDLIEDTENPSESSSEGSREHESGSGGGNSGSGGGGHSGDSGSSEGGPGETRPEVIETVPAVTNPETVAPEKPTDPYGHEIESYSDTIGGEDTAGLEDQESKGGSGNSSDTGKVVIHGDIDPNITDKDIVVVLVDEYGNEHEVYLYAQNGFEASVLLPAGVYYVRKAFVVGDSEGAVYRLVVSENRITVGSTGIVSLTVSLSESGVLINGELSGSGQVSSPAKQKNTAAIVLIIGGLLLIIGIIFIIFLKRKKDEEDEENE